MNKVAARIKIAVSDIWMMTTVLQSDSTITKRQLVFVLAPGDIDVFGNRTFRCWVNVWDRWHGDSSHAAELSANQFRTNQSKGYHVTCKRVT